MARLVKVGERIINLDQVKFFERKEEQGELVVDVIMEPLVATWMTDGIFDRADAVVHPPQNDREVRPLNMSFRGGDAKVFWEKLCEAAEVWGLPNEMPKQ